MENDFHIKKIRAKERVTFQNEGKYRDVTSLNNRDKVKCVIRKGNFMLLSLKVRRGSVERKNLATARVLLSF